MACSKGQLRPLSCPTRDVASLIDRAFRGSSDTKPILILIGGSGRKRRITPRPALTNWSDYCIHNISYSACDYSLILPLQWQAEGRSEKFSELYKAAGIEAEALAKLLNFLGKNHPTRKVDILCQSFGARVALKAVEQMQFVNVHRILMMSAIEFGGPALCALSSKFAHKIDFYNVSLETLGPELRKVERSTPKPGRADQLISRSFPFQRNNWLDVKLDTEIWKSGLKRLRYHVTVPTQTARMSALDMHPTVYAFCQAMLEQKPELSPDLLKRLIFETQINPTPEAAEKTVPRMLPRLVLPKNIPWLQACVRRTQ